MKKRNGEIDILRFVFAVLIVLHHFGDLFGVSRFKYGYIGVEFFFLASGMFMARHASHISSTRNEIANETWKYEINKAKSFYRYYVLGIILNISFRMVFIKHQSFTKIWNAFLRSIPTFGLFFIETNGDDIGLYLPNTWFLSAMMLSCFILYPLLLWNYERSSKLIFPMLSIFILGLIYHAEGRIDMNHADFSVVSWGFLRAVAEMALGSFLFPASSSFSDQAKLKNRGYLWKISITAIKCFCYLQVMLFALDLIGGNEYSLHMLFFCAIGIFLSASEEGFSIPDTRLTRYLGKISLPIFLFHGTMRRGLNELLGENISKPLFLALTFGSIVLSVLLMYLADFIFTMIHRKKKTFAR